MVKVTVNGLEYYMDENIKANLDRAKHHNMNDWDFTFIIDGRERGGKSVLAQQLAIYVDNSFCLERVCFTASEFKRAVLNAQPHQAIIYDEAFTGLSSKDSMNRTNKLLVQMLAEIGQKNLFIFIVMPTFFDLTKYVALWRSRALIHIYTGDDFQRGFFAFYNDDLKKTLYIDGKDYYNYKGSKYNFVGRFTNFYVLDEKLYRAKKRKSLADKDDIKDTEDEKKEHIDWLFDYLQGIDGLNEVTKQKILGMPPTTYYWRRKRFEERKAELTVSE